MQSDDALLKQESEKYVQAWNWPKYREKTDGGPLVDHAFAVMGCQPGESLIDWGCGTGRPAAAFARRGLVVHGVDIAPNCLDEDVLPQLQSFTVATMWDPLLPAWLESDYAFCTDVLEHIPPEKLDACLLTIRSRTHKAAVIQVFTELDRSGPKMSPPQRLHLSVQSAEAWHQQLEGYWSRVHQQLAKGARAAFLCWV